MNSDQLDRGIILRLSLRHVLPLAAAVVATPLPPSSVAVAGESYEIEFRSRPGDYFGHSFVVLRKGGRHAAVRRVAGFYPDPKAEPLDTLGGVPGVITSTRADFVTPADADYRVRINRRQYVRALATIAGNARRRPTYVLLEQNCNTFLGSVARAAGLRAPGGSSAVLPSDYVRAIRDLNATPP
jgi:hypothetical protein